MVGLTSPVLCTDFEIKYTPAKVYIARCPHELARALKKSAYHIGCSYIQR